MKYHKEHPSKDVGKALGLDPERIEKLKYWIMKAYDQHWHTHGPNIDQINYAIAPHIQTPEEAFFVAGVIFTDVHGAMMKIMMDSGKF